MRLKTIYPRARMDKLLSGIMDCPLTSMVAGAGYGKTTAAAQYLKKSGIANAWVALTDGNENVFWDKLTDAIEAFDEEAADAMRALGLPADAWSRSRVVKLARAHCRKPLILCIDDYQYLPAESPVHHLVETLAFEDVENLHILLLSRAQPNIRLYTLASRAMALCIDAEALAFTMQETDGYLAMRGLRLTKGAVQRIHGISGGWVSAIYLLGEGVRAGGEIGCVKEIDALFYENLIKPLSQTDREMLYLLSAFENFPLDMAVAALGTERVRDVIVALVRENAFITKDADEVFSFHPLLRKYLSVRCPQDDEQRNVYRRAGLWYAQCPDYRLFFSVELFQKADCLEEFFALVNKPEASRLRYRDVDAICRMAMRISEGMCLAYPFPYLQIVFFMLLSGNARSIQFARGLYNKMFCFFSQSDHPYKDIILGELIVIARVSGLADQSGGRETLTEAARLLNGRASAFLDPSYPFTFGLPMLLHSEYTQAGTLDETLERHRENPYEQVSDGFGRGCVSLNAAEGALFRCDMDAVKRLCAQAIMEANEKQQYFIIASAYSTLMRRALFLGDTEYAAQTLQDLRELVARAARMLENNKMSVSLLREVLMLAECFFNTSLLRIQEIPSDFLDGSHLCGMTQGFGVYQIYAARAMVAAGNPTGARRQIERLESLPNLCQNARGYGMILSAVCAETLDGKGAGLPALTAALAAAEKDGIVLPFAENPDVLPMLKRLKRCDIDKNYFDKLLAQCEAYQRVAPDAAKETQVSLSGRELDVLRLTAQGKTRSETAALFHVQENTVKAQLSSAYRKLGARGKTEAIRLARTYGLF